MFVRRRTLDHLIRQNARDREVLLGVIREQNDRLMILAGRQPLVDWAPAQPDLEPDEPDVFDEAPVLGNPY